MVWIPQIPRPVTPRLWLSALLLLAASVVAQEQPIKIPPMAPAPQRSISVSQQFIIYYSDRLVRSRLARKSEDLKSNWLHCLGLQDEWKTPIILQMHSVRPPRTPRTLTTLYESDGGQLKVQIDIFDPTVLASSDFDLEVYRALCLEYEYRNVPLKSGKSFTQPPNWLLEGIYQDSVAREDGLPPGLFDKLIQNGPPPKLGAFLRQRSENLDATSRAIYRAQALTLLRAFLRVPDGAKHLAEYVASLPGISNADDDKLLEKFPLLQNQPSNLSKLWSLTLADATGSSRIKTLGIPETLKQLDTIFQLTVAKDPKKPAAGNVTGVECLQILSRTDTGRYVVRQKSEELMRLEARAHPLLQPIVEEYRLIATQLGARSVNLEKRLRKNEELCQAVAKRADQISDYVNWFEATQLDTPSREFDAITMPDDSQTAVPRTDAISRRLDDLEARGW
ncbi:hypothetical protein BH09VER1_BH09VER1_20770 [soil metagenome]